MRTYALLLALTPASCTGSRPSTRSPDDSDDSGEIVDSGDTGDTAGTLRLVAEEWLALPFVTVGDAAPTGEIEVVLEGGDASGPLSWGDVTPFTITGDDSPMTAGESRVLEVTYDGPLDGPVNAVGETPIRIDSDDLVVDVHIAAVIGDPLLGDADWETDEWGTRAIVSLPSAPNANGATSWDDDRVLLSVVPGSNPWGLDVAEITHLHGHNAHLEEVLANQLLVEQTALSGRNAVLLVPAGPVEAASGDFGQLMDPGGHERLVRDALAVLYRDEILLWPEPGSQVLTSHSGGYQATAAIVKDGGLQIDAVHLFDSLYGYSGVFYDFVADGGLLRSNYTSGAGTEANNAALRADLRDDGYEVSEDFGDDALSVSEITIGWVRSSHGACMVDDRAYARWLDAAWLERSDAAPPELRAVELSDGEARVRWRYDGGTTRVSWVVQGSDDGASWTDLATVEDGYVADVPLQPWIRVVADRDGVRSAPSDRYGATGDEWLIVDGFDRLFGGSFHEPTHDFATRVGNALGTGFSTASNEAVASGEVGLSGYDRVLWLLGDESIADVTLDDTEKSAIETYLAGGGKLVISGSELGYATDGAWLSSRLHAVYAADDAGTTQAEGWTFGTVYPEDYPDVFSAGSGATVEWTYSTGGGAAVVWKGQTAVIGFPLETLEDDDLADALAEVQGWLD